MTMFANKNNLMSATLLSAVAALASCGRSEPPPAASIAAPVVQLAEVEDGVDMSLPTVVERRHFAIYNSYRVLFDDSPDVFHSRAKGQEDGLQQTVMALDGDVSACSMRGMLLKD